MVSARNGLERGLRSQPETGLGRGGKAPVVSDKGPGPLTLRKRIATKTISSEASKVFTKRKSTSSVRVDRHTGGLRERESR